MKFSYFISVLKRPSYLSGSQWIIFLFVTNEINILIERIKHYFTFDHASKTKITDY